MGNAGSTKITQMGQLDCISDEIIPDGMCGGFCCMFMSYRRLARFIPSRLRQSGPVLRQRAKACPQVIDLIQTPFLPPTVNNGYNRKSPQ
jgi:hypothetical protein